MIVPSSSTYLLLLIVTEPFFDWLCMTFPELFTFILDQSSSLLKKREPTECLASLQQVR